MKHEQRTHESHEIGARKNMRKIFVLARGDRDGMEEMWSAEMLVLLRRMSQGRLRKAI